MNIKTMEGLIGAVKNIGLVNTPMRVYKEARRTGELCIIELNTALHQDGIF